MLSRNALITSISLVMTIIGTSSAWAKNKHSCHGNHACKRVFYLLSDYSEQESHLDKKHFNKLIRNLSNQNVVIYRTGESYQVYVPHGEMFYKNSANLKEGVSQRWKSIVDLLDTYKPSRVTVRGIVAEQRTEDEKNLIEPIDLARKQARVLLGRMRQVVQDKNIEFVSGEAAKVDKHLAFWRATKDYEPGSQFTILEFDTKSL